VLFRLPWLLGELAWAGLHYPFRAGQERLDSRTRWLQVHCRRVLRVLHVEVGVEGPLPNHGLLACNHMSYVDILALGSLAPTIFVAKQEVRGWPVFGWLASMGGTIFVRRDSPRASLQSAGTIQKALENGALVALFPEGTSTGGDTVLPFKSSLLGGAIQGRHPVYAGCIHYPLKNGRVAEEICYWRDMTLVPHLLNLLSRPGITMRISIRPLEEPQEDRRSLAKRLHAEVLAMKQALMDRAEA
jgi:1-acyl-sn-glycerol-3-phosphate acyltransferase